MLAPSVGLLTAFVFIPIVLAIWLSFQQWSSQTPFASARWIGLDNYREIFGPGSVGRDFTQALKNTVIYAACSIAVILPLSVAFGLLVHQARLRGKTILRTLLFSTYMVPMVAVALVWSKLYSPSEGPINQMLGWVGIAPFPWLSSPDTALYSLVILNVWQQTGYFTVLAVAGLTQIPESVLEAAKIDGARRLGLLWYVILPLLRRTLLFSGIIVVINAVQVFEPVAMITQGGPVGSTNVVTYHVRRVGIERSQGGLGSAMAMILMLLLAAIVSAVFVTAGRRSET
jgi:multiple sugar transport system permease protein/sn-glycerol 3-phosphate transport system permease protein